MLHSQFVEAEAPISGVTHLSAKLRRCLGLIFIALPKIVRSFLPSFETYPNLNFFEFLFVTFDEKFNRKLGRKLCRIFGRAI